VQKALFQLFQSKRLKKTENAKKITSSFLQIEIEFCIIGHFANKFHHHETAFET
jgi:hypothetical protein